MASQCKWDKNPFSFPCYLRPSQTDPVYLLKLTSLHPPFTCLSHTCCLSFEHSKSLSLVLRIMLFPTRFFWNFLFIITQTKTMSPLDKSFLTIQLKSQTSPPSYFLSCYPGSSSPYDLSVPENINLFTCLLSVYSHEQMRVAALKILLTNVSPADWLKWSLVSTV